MRKPLIAGNWKMNTSIEEAGLLVESMLADLDRSRDSVDVLLCPPFVSLKTVSDLLKASHVALGAQNMYFEDKGAFTGEISPLMLKGLCKYVIIGHSERRHIFAESDEMIAKKVSAAISHGILPILCVGETLGENENDKTEEVIGRQVRSALAGLEPQGEMVVAYEPVWAIGTGKAATVNQAQTTIALIRNLIAGIWGREGAGTTRILYGGSVTPSNISELAQCPDVDGALVGGASLKAGDFSAIVRYTADVYADK